MLVWAARGQANRGQGDLNSQNRHHDKNRKRRTYISSLSRPSPGEIRPFMRTHRTRTLAQRAETERRACGPLANSWLTRAHLLVITPSQRHDRAATPPTAIGSTAEESSQPDSSASAARRQRCIGVTPATTTARRSQRKLTSTVCGSISAARGAFDGALESKLAGWPIRASLGRGVGHRDAVKTLSRRCRRDAVWALS